MLKLVNKSKDKRIEIICSQVTNLFLNQDFWKEIIKQKENYHLSNVNGLILFDLFHQSKIELSINVFKSKNPWSKSNGYTNPENPNDIYLNTRKFNRSDASIASTICHECVHVVDNSSDPKFFFGHGDNYDTPEKNACAPQQFSDLAYKYLSAGVVSSVLPIKEKYLV